MNAWSFMRSCELLAGLAAWIADRLQSWWAAVIFWMGFIALVIWVYLLVKGASSHTLLVPGSAAFVLITVALVLGPRGRG